MVSKLPVVLCLPTNKFAWQKKFIDDMSCIFKKILLNYKKKLKRYRKWAYLRDQETDKMSTQLNDLLRCDTELFHGEALTIKWLHCCFPDPMYRTRYYQEAQEGLYSGPLFLLSYWLFSLPFSFLTVAASSRIIFESVLFWKSKFYL